MPFPFITYINNKVELKMKLKNKDLRKLLIKCYEKRTLEEQDILLKYFMEVETIIILAGEVISMVKKGKKTKGVKR